MMEAYSPIAVAILIPLIWCAAFWDVRVRRIPNVLVLVALITGFGVQAGFAGLEGILTAAGGLFAGMVVLLPGYLAGATGAGDVKLMGAVGSFIGASNAFFAALSSLAVGALIALGFMMATLLSPGLEAPWRRYGTMLKTLIVTGKPVYLAPEQGEVMGRRFPFALSIAVGTTSLIGWQFLASG